VGPHVDVSNEAGPQSETSIAINPSDQSQIVAASNEIFRVPMRGYFSAIGGSSWGGVDPCRRRSPRTDRLWLRSLGDLGRSPLPAHH